MKQKRETLDRLLLAELAILAIATGTAVVLTGAIWLIIVGAAVAVNFYILLRLERRKFEVELECTSRMLDNLILGNDSRELTEHEDTLPSKIQHQFVKLQSIVANYSETAKRDKEEIRLLIAEIAHQLRTPLTNIQTYLHLLKEANLREEEKDKYVSAVEVSEQKLEFLIESFIKMSRLESRIIQIKKENRDLKETVLSCLAQSRRAAEKRDIRLSFQCRECAPVAHDRNWLGEAIFNLLDNSIKYSPEHGQVEVLLIQNEMFAQIAVRDFGPGISGGEEAQIFKRFYRGKNVTTQEGFGLGLYLAREIVTEHQGFLKVKRENPGLTVSIYLPFS